MSPVATVSATAAAPLRRIHALLEAVSISARSQGERGCGLGAI